MNRLELNMLKKMLLVSSICFLFTASYTATAEIVVVVNKANTADIDEKTVQRIFLGKEKKFGNGNAAVPINLETNNASRAEFDEQMLGRSSSQVSAYWSKLVFTGKGVPPAELANDAAVLAAIEADANAIGYINSASVTDAVRVVATK